MMVGGAWRRWRAVRIELAELLARRERQHRQSSAPAVQVGGRRYTEAAQRFRTMITAKVARLNSDKPVPGVPTVAAWRIRRLEQEARRLAAEILARPIAGALDVLARLDIIAAM